MRSVDAPEGVLTRAAGRPTLGMSTRGLIVLEVVLLLGLSLGRSGLYAAVDLIAAWTTPGGLAGHSAVMNGSLAPGREYLDLTLQILGIIFGLVPAAMAAFLLVRDGKRLSLLWFDAAHIIGDLRRGLLLAAAIGGSGLVFYLITFAAGVDLAVVAEDLPHVWWRIPVLVLAALQDALLEETVILGYLLTRLEDLRVSPRVAIPLAAVLRGSYHLYQGLGGFFGNLAMGLVFGWLYHRWRRITPMLVAHTLIDIVAFVGFALLAGHVSWLPT